MTAASGTITLSIEIELGWGGDSVGEYISSNRSAETEYLERLIGKCETHNIPITFDVVGALVDPERDIQKIPGQEPVSNPTAPEYYAPDLIERIRESPVDHEFATHTYSHYVYDDKDRFIEEIVEAKRVHEAIGIGVPASLIGPRNELPPTDVLAEARLDTVRVPVSTPTSSNVSRFFKVLRRTHPVSEVGTTCGVIETYSTWETSLTAPYFLPMGQRPTHPAYRWLPQAVRKRIHRRYLRSALERTVREQSHSHFWTHLYNVSNPVQWELVSEFLDELGKSQQTGDIDVKTMDELKTVANG